MAIEIGLPLFEVGYWGVDLVPIWGMLSRAGSIGMSSGGHADIVGGAEENAAWCLMWRKRVEWASELGMSTS